MVPVLDICADPHVGYTIMSICILVIGTAAGCMVPLGKFYDVDNECTTLQRKLSDAETEVSELRDQLLAYKMATDLSMRILRSTVEDSDSSDADV